MPIANIYVALIFFTENPNAIKTRVCYVPGHNSKEAEMLLRMEKFEILSRSDVFSYIQTDDSVARSHESGSARIHWRDEDAQPVRPMTSTEFARWREMFTQGDEPVYRRALP